MKHKDRISELTLELYYRGLATYKERKQVEKALKTDNAVQNRYNALQESEREIQQILSQEFRRFNISETPSAPVPHSVNIVWGLVAAAVLIGALVPTFLYIKANRSNKNNAVAESPAGETTQEIDTQETETPEETIITENIPIEDKVPAPEQPVKRERGSFNEKTEIAAIPETDIVIRFRGQSGAAETPEEDADIAIPLGITFIFENMFANKFLVWIDIPDRIKSIAKNAYAGNPVVYVTIGANVDVHDEAIPGNFAKAYNSYGRQAGNYSRPDSNSEEWKKD